MQNAALAIGVLVSIGALSGCTPYTSTHVRRQPLSPPPAASSPVRLVDVDLNGKVACTDCDDVRAKAIAAAQRGLHKLRRTVEPPPACGSGECLRVIDGRVCMARRVLDAGPALRIGVVVEHLDTGDGGVRALVLGDAPVTAKLRVATWDEQGNEIDQQSAYFSQKPDASGTLNATITLSPGHPLYAFDRDLTTPTVQARAFDGGILAEVVHEITERFALQFSDEPSLQQVTLVFLDDDALARPGIKLAENHQWAEALAAWERVPQKSPTLLYDMAIVRGALGEDDRKLALLEDAARTDRRWLIVGELEGARRRQAFRRRPRPPACTF